MSAFPELTPEQIQQYKQWLNQLQQDWGAMQSSGYKDIQAAQTEIYQTVLSRLPSSERVCLLVYCAQEMFKIKNSYWRSPESALTVALLRKNLPVSSREAVWLLSTVFADASEGGRTVWYSYPVMALLKQIEKHIGTVTDDELRDVLQLAYQRVSTSNIRGSEVTVLEQKLQQLLGIQVDKVAFFYNDDFAQAHSEALAALPIQQQVVWGKIFTHAVGVKKASKPSAVFLKTMRTYIDELGEAVFKQQVTDWFTWICYTKGLSCHDIDRTRDDWWGYWMCTKGEPVAEDNLYLIKCLVWSCALCADEALLATLNALALRCYAKVKGVGMSPLTNIGNACLYVFAQSGLSGMKYLSRLLLRVKANNIRKIIDKYINEAAERHGVSRQTIEDMGVEGFGLDENGVYIEMFASGHSCRLQITGVGKSSLEWFKADGSPQKTVPAVVKEQHAEQLKALKLQQKNLNMTLTTQRDRLDRMMRGEQRMAWDYFQEYYWHHGVMGWLARGLIWRFFQDENDTQGVAAFYVDGEWVNHAGESVDVVAYSQVMLWHPVTAEAAEVLAWRKLLAEKQIQQPFKQAYREIYLITDAELKTRTYSNRFAAHILKQHQYINLARGRGWQGSVQSSWDYGNGQITALALPEYGLRAEFWTDGVGEEYSDSGMFLYTATDQVRFYHEGENDAPINLIDVPVRVFSEVMRDVDLFVGVASVGNDPHWQDNGGLPQYRDYWQSYSFGALVGEVAKSRKEVLETLLPRLKISKVAHIEDNFLVVQGKIRTYKIHIGSGNILMSPNDQYLCIVPDRSKKDPTQGLFVPFEGDAMLSLVLSKAMLLADESKITDPTILLQIGQ
ncbi:DUF4132 domain-containing protein [Conchiformibius steedae DSM 2580]|uniref:DUF4132 domain-containing protein n=1 Tax=Conchiformibius steedae DSM 2580 TaxID=1121352 RepID=A0AAE9KZX4_9NEIS|nr:DUF4132 domain-containing protein [Conchiformibius steedae]QMT32706.1 DUF4132 domain-containing protein [Conchiformibius steedae]URD67315.1 DUF4132 domain-containing protein [Conchiformibius steedae DSM 2580]